MVCRTHSTSMKNSVLFWALKCLNSAFRACTSTMIFFLLTFFLLFLSFAQHPSALFRYFTYFLYRDKLPLLLNRFWLYYCILYYASLFIIIFKLSIIVCFCYYCNATINYLGLSVFKNTKAAIELSGWCIWMISLCKLTDVSVLCVVQYMTHLCYLEDFGFSYLP